MPSAVEIVNSQRETWAGLACGWAKWDEIIMGHLRPVTTAMIARLRVAEDQVHLDVASGTGEPGLTIAALAPRGRVVLTDLAEEMLDVALCRAEEAGVPNVGTRICSADHLPFGDAGFDSVTVRFGYMFFPDAARATAEIVRVLKPGGRVCAAVWSDPSDNPWTTILTEAIAAELAMPPADADTPNKYRCAAPGHVSALFDAAGLRDVSEWEVGVELVTSTPAEYWEVMIEHVSVAAAAVRQADSRTRERIRAAVIAEVGRYRRGDVVRVPGRARCIGGTK